MWNIWISSYIAGVDRYLLLDMAWVSCRSVAQLKGTRARCIQWLGGDLVSKIFGIFTRKFGEMIHFDSYFSDGVETTTWTQMMFGPTKQKDQMGCDMLWSTMTIHDILPQPRPCLLMPTRPQQRPTWQRWVWPYHSVRLPNHPEIFGNWKMWGKPTSEQRYRERSWK